MGAVAEVPILHAMADVVAAQPLLLVILGIAALGASVVVGLALAVYVRRRSGPYLLVTLAVGAIFTRVIVATLSLNGSLDDVTHHLAEHALDAVMVALVIAAVYTARNARLGGEMNE